MTLRLLALIAVLVGVAAAPALAAPPAAQPIVLPGLTVIKVTELNLGGQAYPQTFTPNADKACYEWETTSGGVGIAQYHLRVVDTGTGRILSKSLVPGLDLPAAPAPALSPDGRTLLVNGGGLWRTNLEGVTPESITSSKYKVASCAWSPDGREIAFLKIVYKDPENPDSGATRAIAFMDPQQPDVLKREIPVSPGVSIMIIQYSPDGRWLALTLGSQLNVMDVETGKLHPIFDGRLMGLSFSPTSISGKTNAAWLFDSQRLLVTLRDSEMRFPRQIWLLDLKGETHQLAEGALVWGRADGRLLVITKDKRFWKVELGPGKTPTRN